MSELARYAPAPGAAPARPGRPRAAAADAMILAGRCTRLSLRNTDALITSLVLPVLLMLMFVYLFGGAIRTGTAYAEYVVPGVLVLCAGFGAALTAVRVSEDMAGPVTDRLRSMDVGGTALVAGHVAASVIRNAVAMVLVTGVALAIGFRPQAGPAGWLAAAGLLLLFITVLSWLSAAAGLLASSPEAASGATFAMLFLPYASSGFVPVATLPSWLRGFARQQPCTPVIDTLRSLLRPGAAAAAWGPALAWCAGLLAVSAAAAALAYRRRTAR